MSEFPSMVCLCRSNPYYIVQQGQVKRITAMKDADRLGLLKEVAGTRVYEERRAESLKIMEDTDTKREQVTARRRSSG